MKLIDIHTHLDKLEEGVEQALALGEAAGVGGFITIGTDPEDLPVVLKLAETHYPKVLCTLGIHPHEAELYTPEVAQFIKTHAPQKEVAAVGEIGLDFFYKTSDPQIQRRAFDEQMFLASELQMPVEIHTRDAEAETLEILNKYKGQVRGLLHCFTGTLEMAKKSLDMGFNISFSGIVTFKNAEALREVLKFVPLDRLHIETDAPFLAPVPMRGRSNTSAYLVHTADFVAQWKGLSREALALQTAQNLVELFPKMSITVKDCIH